MMTRLSILLLLSNTLLSQTIAPAASTPMRTLYVQDQRDRGAPVADDGVGTLSKAEAAKLPDLPWPEITKRDEARQAQVRAMLDAGKLTTGEDFHEAAFIFQHGQKPADYLLAHVLASQALVLGFTRAKWIAAATLDRYLLSIGQAQIYGTQYHNGLFAFYTQHRADPNVTEELNSLPKAEKEAASQQPYDESLLPDVLRTSVCIASHSLQDAYIADMNAGKAAQLPRVTNCQR